MQTISSITFAKILFPPVLNAAAELVDREYNNVI